MNVSGVKKVELDEEAKSAILNALYDRSRHLRKEGKCFSEQEVLNDLCSLICGHDVMLIVS